MTAPLNIMDFNSFARIRQALGHIQETEALTLLSTALVMYRALLVVVHVLTGCMTPMGLLLAVRAWVRHL